MVFQSYCHLPAKFGAISTIDAAEPEELKLNSIKTTVQRMENSKAVFVNTTSKRRRPVIT